MWTALLGLLAWHLPPWALSVLALFLLPLGLAVLGTFALDLVLARALGRPSLEQRDVHQLLALASGAVVLVALPSLLLLLKDHVPAALVAGLLSAAAVTMLAQRWPRLLTYAAGSALLAWPAAGLALMAFSLLFGEVGGGRASPPRALGLLPGLMLLVVVGVALTGCRRLLPGAGLRPLLVAAVYPVTAVVLAELDLALELAVTLGWALSLVLARVGVGPSPARREIDADAARRLHGGPPE